MARLLGVEIPNDKRIEASLLYIHGIGRTTSLKVLSEAGIDPNIRTGALSDEQIANITHVVQNGKILIEGDLRREQQGHLKRLAQIQCLPRHPPPVRDSPAAGQRTKTNARTRKGGKKTVGAVK